MKKVYMLTVIFLMLGLVSVKSHGLGLGIIIGEPTGISVRVGKFPIMGVSWSIFQDRLAFTLDGWFINNSIKEPVDWYLGMGATMYIHSTGIGQNEIGAGIRVPIGLQVWPDENWELFMEFAPTLLFIPATTFDPEGGLGFRYYF